MFCDRGSFLEKRSVSHFAMFVCLFVLWSDIIWSCFSTIHEAEMPGIPHYYQALGRQFITTVNCLRAARTWSPVSSFGSSAEDFRDVLTVRKLCANRQRLTRGTRDLSSCKEGTFVDRHLGQRN